MNARQEALAKYTWSRHVEEMKEGIERIHEL
jgi:hypothetical protein